MPGIAYNTRVMILAATIQTKILELLPLLCTYVCFGMSLVCVLRGMRMFTKRYQMQHEGLHASSAVKRHDVNGAEVYYPVFAYTGADGQLFDIMGEEAFSSEQEALLAHRPPVYADERPDAAQERSCLVLFMRPLGMLILGLAFLGGMVLAISLLPK